MAGVTCTGAVGGLARAVVGALREVTEGRGAGRTLLLRQRRLQCSTEGRGHGGHQGRRRGGVHHLLRLARDSAIAVTAARRHGITATCGPLRHVVPVRDARLQRNATHQTAPMQVTAHMYHSHKTCTYMCVWRGNVLLLVLLVHLVWQCIDVCMKVHSCIATVVITNASKLVIA